MSGIGSRAKVADMAGRIELNTSFGQVSIRLMSWWILIVHCSCGLVVLVVETFQPDWVSLAMNPQKLQLASCMG